MRKKIAILSDFDVTKRPRPFRLAMMLKEKYRVIAISPSCGKIEGVESFSFPPMKSSKQRSVKENDALFDLCVRREFDKLIYTPNRAEIEGILASLSPIDVIAVEDIALLPFALEHAKKRPGTKTLVDLREYYPLEYENDPEWMKSFGTFFEYLCATFLPQASHCIGVSEGIAQKYREVYGIKCDVFHSLPPYFSLSPSEVSSPVEIIYHGFLSKDRDSQNLLELASELDVGFRLSVMGLSNQKGFLENLKKQASKMKNVTFLPPVPMQEIIPFCNRFDAGIISLPPNGFNNANALPNKFFEYVQSRLCVISTPLSQIKPLIERNGIGRVSQDFGPISLARVLNGLDVETIKECKLASSNHALQYSMCANQTKIIKIIEDLTKT